MSDPEGESLSTAPPPSSLILPLHTPNSQVFSSKMSDLSNATLVFSGGLWGGEAVTLTYFSGPGLPGALPHLSPPERDISVWSWQKHQPTSQVALYDTSSAGDPTVILRSHFPLGLSFPICKMSSV